MGQVSANDLRSGSCDPVAQTGCGTNEKCVPDHDLDLCLPLSSPAGAIGTECVVAAGDTCAAGEVCIETTDSRAFVCHQICRVDADCTGPTLSGAPAPACDLSLTDSTVATCTPSCNPVGAVTGGAGCGAGLTCALQAVLLVPQTAALIVDCASPGSAGLGASCVDTDDCVPGAVCSGATCQQVCHIGGHGECPSTQSCVGFAGLSEPSPFGTCG